MLDGIVIRRHIFSQQCDAMIITAYRCDECFMSLSGYEYICPHFVCTY